MTLLLWACVTVDADHDGLSYAEDCDDHDGATLGPTVWYPDLDGDFSGDPLGPITTCAQPDGYLARPGDCDDTDPETRPGADEVCDFEDNNCNGVIDEGAVDVAMAWPDVDGDGFGATDQALALCRDVDGWVGTPGDCDDTDPLVGPDGEEVPYDGVDGDCDGWDDFDADEDGFVAAAYDGPDCDDDDPDTFPGAPDLCRSGTDEGCDGVDSDTCTFWGGPLRLQRAVVVGPAGSSLGRSAVVLGDADGDHLPDLALGAPDTSDEAFGAGAVYVARGPVLGRVFTDDVAGWADADPVTALGSGVAAVGDVDGDGRADLAVGAGTAGLDLDERGEVRVVVSPFDDATTAAPWAVLLGEGRDDHAGAALSGVDFGADGAADLLVGAPGAGLAREGAVFVHPLTDPGVHPLGATGARWSGDPGDLAGSAVSWVGDTDGDGLDDALIGAPGAASATGADAGGRVYLVRGPPPGALVLPVDADASWRGTHGAESVDPFGEVRGAALGTWVAPAGDLDGDGTADVAFGAPFDADHRLDGGRVFAASGRSSGDLDVASVMLTILPEHEADQLSRPAAGDFDGDGGGDLAVGAPSAHGGTFVRTGRVYLFRGPLSGVRYAWDGDGVLFGTEPGEAIGASVFGLGDLDGDGCDDLAIGGVDLLWLAYGQP